MTNKEIVLTLNLIPSKQFITLIYWFKESRHIKVLNCISEQELLKAIVYLKVRNLSYYYYLYLVVVNLLLKKCNGCKKLYNLGETQ